ncbi:hypothetical protein HMPREF3155_08505 [Corynebacterium sp. HMSC06D04]|uniref:PrgI family protein n=1 Tax=Corynebacterium pseudogenitalium ATCC 33035 TaxID=525264 RepID=E2S779_9CORY|nr:MULTISPECIES: SCO6880 family protein [Corynebacterium]EFQ79367.1 hypothetical protein HMPREF0305_12381 [Corynebacterium pseudogenitalium ATCC 33035]MDK2583989.1 hypothetical protein [Corynebacterium sp. BWA136]MDK8877563.1 hypothetical protein [Corynebacterium striatum]OFT50531.1 hypothetical protein HMPREF3155_08505 [Corynebacterium sp. HMSC06D04]
MADNVDVPVYALGQPSRRTGIGGFSMKTTIVLGAGFIGFLVCQLGGMQKIGFLVVLPITVIIALLVSLNVGGRSVAQVSEMIFQDWRRRARGDNVYISGPSSRLAGGRYRLPGSLARTELLEGTDAVGRDFGVVFDRHRREATVLFSCQLSGQTAMTQEERNDMTANWGRWLAGLSLSGDVVSTVFVTNSRPDTGELVAKEVQATVHDDAPEVAKRIMQEASDELSVGIPETEAHIAVTLKVSVAETDDTSFLQLIGTRLPGLYEELTWSGIQAAPMDAEEVCARAHKFFNPAAEGDFEEISVGGNTHDLEWFDAGPAFHDVRKNVYRHDGVSSVTWEMASAPRSTFEDTLLGNLIAPHARIDRKRVALVYRPYEAGTGASRVEAEHRDAMVAANSSKKIRSAAAEMRLEHTEAARRAQARGAQLGRYSLFVTATTEDEELLGRIRHDVKQLGAQANLRLREMSRQQDAGFITSCGLGQIPWTKESTSALAAQG